MAALRAIYKYLASLIVLGVLVQFAFAGYGAFFVSTSLKDDGDVLGHKAFDHAWRFHTGFGWIVIYATVLLFIVGLIARIGRPRIWFTLALGIAGVVQGLLAYLGEDHAKAGFLHPLNALVILALAGSITHRAWREPTASA